MGDYLEEPVIPADEFEPEADVFRIWVSHKERNGTKNGQPVRIKYWQALWEIPREFRTATDTAARPNVSASSTISREDAEAKCRAKVVKFWQDRAQHAREETFEHRPKRLTKEERAARYTVQSFLEEWFASRTNPNAAPQNRWRPNTAKGNKTKLEKWIYPELGAIPLNELTHDQVRKHFTETLPGVLDDNDQPVLSDRRIKGIYSTFKLGMKQAGGKGFLEEGEYMNIGIQATFEAAGVPEDIEDLMWEMNALLQRPDVQDDPLALRWALAYGQGLRRGERCGLKWSDIDMTGNRMTIARQLSYIAGQPEFLDERLKANEKRTITTTPITRPFILKAYERRQREKSSPNWNPREGFEDLVLLREDGSPENLNRDNTLFHEFMTKYGITYSKLSPGALRHASATFFANFAGTTGRGVSRENLRKFLGHSPDSKLDAYYARASLVALDEEFGGVEMQGSRARMLQLFRPTTSGGQDEDWGSD